MNRYRIEKTTYPNGAKYSIQKENFMQRSYRGRGLSSHQTEYEKTYFWTALRTFDSETEAKEFLQNLKQQGYNKTIIKQEIIYIDQDTYLK